MKKIVDDWRLIYKVCSLYYEDDMRQQEISDYLGISRATISRMLQKEKEINFKERIAGMPAEQIKKIRNRIGIV